MIDFEEARRKLKSEIKEKRYNHSIRVVDKAIELAKIYGEDVEKAKMASLLHDCAKGIEKKCFNLYKDKYNLDDSLLLDGIESHQILGSIHAREEYLIDDEDILRAIENHTTGRIGMSRLEKIVFSADAIEDGRDYPGVEELRSISDKGLDSLVLGIMNHNLAYLALANLIIDIKTVDARNYLLRKGINA